MLPAGSLKPRRSENKELVSASVSAESRSSRDLRAWLRDGAQRPTLLRSPCDCGYRSPEKSLYSDKESGAVQRRAGAFLRSGAGSAQSTVTAALLTQLAEQRVYTRWGRPDREAGARSVHTAESAKRASVKHRAAPSLSLSGSPAVIGPEREQWSSAPLVPRSHGSLKRRPADVQLNGCFGFCLIASHRRKSVFPSKSTAKATGPDEIKR
ncbi:hypothetical protein AAFF_G00106240 [Aldrovandia affinis]|uniref:Uncharacterized protein n=1 Tax=Aldrovandia affinis TaxID=143900 RepID=A0AAD7T232_9TELE|nr:hypothetical protein AAFF_G00106240 [Aldrovandia affinis]